MFLKNLKGKFNMPNNNKEKKASCGLDPPRSKSCDTDPYFNEVEMSDIDELYSKGGFNTEESPSLPIELDSCSDYQEKVIKFQEKVMKHIKKITNSIKCTIEQKKIILFESEKILKKQTLKAVDIQKNSSLPGHASTIIYAVLVSIENMPQITGKRLAEIAQVSYSLPNKLYTKWYENLAPRLVFSFSQSKTTREKIFLYFFGQLINTKLNSTVNMLEIITHLKNSIISNNSKEIKLTVKEIEMLQKLLDTYSNAFNKYLIDMFKIANLMIESFKSHKIIKTHFSVKHFVRYFINQGINLQLSDSNLFYMFGEIFKKLRQSKFSNIIPSRFGEGSGNIERSVAGARIKLYIMKHFHKGVYFDLKNGVAKCPDCLNERKMLTVSNISQRIQAKDFHHSSWSETYEIEDIIDMKYNARALYDLFCKDRGNPYFLPDLLTMIEKNDKIHFKCSCHHKLIHAPLFYYFKKLICWENIPNEFPQDIFDLPAEIIHILVTLCIENANIQYVGFSDVKKKRLGIRFIVLYYIKKKYIIDLIYEGKCPICKEFVAKDHLPVFEFNHLKEIYDLKNIISLYNNTCSEIVRLLEDQRGGYICRNCHRTIHTKRENINMIYDDPDRGKMEEMDYDKTVNDFLNNLIHSKNSIENPLKSQFDRHDSFLRWLLALYELSEMKGFKEGITRQDLRDHLNNIGAYKHIFEKRKVSEKYVKIVAGRSTGGEATLYYINPEGIKIIHLIKYFQKYFKNTPSIRLGQMKYEDCEDYLY